MTAASGRGGERRVLYAEFTALPGKGDEVASLIRDLTVSVRQEPGNLAFAAHRKESDPLEFFVYEEYQDEAAFQTHLAADHGARFNAALASLVVGGGSTLTFLRPA
ncbi:MAG: antibiotic biosynthesis monooxygenase [Cryobacterium sp.]|jgi:quinol monooxygenase YgiN|nr:antibiotic biosynthesis monooxygenase [Cryobacterium sp.]